jgi:hypothetical protein
MAAWRKLAEASTVEHASPDFSIFSLAQILVTLAHRFPGRTGDFYRSFDIGVRPCDVRDYGKDLLPLPRPTLDIHRSLQEGGPFLSRTRRKSIYREAAVELWTYLAVMSVNFTFLGTRASQHWWAHSGTTPGQLTALATIRSRVEYFCRDALALIPTPSWKDEIKKRADYT